MTASPSPQFDRLWGHLGNESIGERVPGHLDCVGCGWDPFSAGILECASGQGELSADVIHPSSLPDDERQHLQLLGASASLTSQPCQTYPRTLSQDKLSLKLLCSQHFITAKGNDQDSIPDDSTGECTQLSSKLLTTGSWLSWSHVLTFCHKHSQAIQRQRKWDEFPQTHHQLQKLPT